MPRILIADDNKDLLNILELMFLENGYETFCTTLKKDLMSALRTFNPDLILLDVFLDKHDGRQLCREITFSSTHKGVPVILISANPYSLSDYKIWGAVDFINKPVDFPLLLDKIQKYIALPIKKTEDAASIPEIL